MESSIEQNGRDINLKVSQYEFNKSKETLSKVIADITVNTMEGITLRYDENGAIALIL